MTVRYCLEALIIDVSQERIDMIEEPYRDDLSNNGNCISSDRVELVLWTVSIQ